MTNMDLPGLLTKPTEGAVANTDSTRAEMVRGGAPRSNSVQPELHGDVYLFIYRIRHSYDLVVAKLPKKVRATLPPPAG